MNKGDIKFITTIKHIKKVIFTKRHSLFFFFFYHHILPPSTLSHLILFFRSPQTEFKVSSKSQLKGYVLFVIFSTRNQLMVLQILINSSLQNSYSNDSYMALASLFSFRGIFSMYLGLSHNSTRCHYFKLKILLFQMHPLLHNHTSSSLLIYLSIQPFFYTLRNIFICCHIF